MELDLQRLFGLHVHSCTHWLGSRNTPPPGIWAHIRWCYWSAKIDDISLWYPARNKQVTFWASAHTLKRGTARWEPSWFDPFFPCNTRTGSFQFQEKNVRKWLSIIHEENWNILRNAAVNSSLFFPSYTITGSFQFQEKNVWKWLSITTRKLEKSCGMPR